MTIFKQLKFKMLVVLMIAILICCVGITVLGVNILNQEKNSETLYINHVSGDSSVFDEVGLSGMITDTNLYRYDFFIDNQGKNFEITTGDTVNDTLGIGYFHVNIGAYKLINNKDKLYIDRYELNMEEADIIDVFIGKEVEYYQVADDEGNTSEVEETYFFNEYKVEKANVSFRVVDARGYWVNVGDADFYYDFSGVEDFTLKGPRTSGLTEEEFIEYNNSTDLLFESQEITEVYYPESDDTYINFGEMSAKIHDKQYFILPTNEFSVGKNGIYTFYDNDVERVAYFDINEENKANKIAVAIIAHHDNIVMLSTQNKGEKEELFVSVLDTNTNEFISEDFSIGEFSLSDSPKMYREEDFVVIQCKTEEVDSFVSIKIGEDGSAFVVDSTEIGNIESSYIQDAFYENGKFYILRYVEEYLQASLYIEKKPYVSSQGIYNIIEVYENGENLYIGEVVTDIWEYRVQYMGFMKEIYDMKFIKSSDFT